jgi:hypothetical protein
MYSIAAMALEEGGGGGAAWPGKVATTGCVLRMAPMMKNVMPMPSAEMRSEGLRPRLSTPKSTKVVVAITLMMP